MFTSCYNILQEWQPEVLTGSATVSLCVLLEEVTCSRVGTGPHLLAVFLSRIGENTGKKNKLSAHHRPRGEQTSKGFL